MRHLLLFYHFTELNFIDAWIGASDLDHDGVWTWIEGTECSLSPWQDGEPSGNGQCVGFYGYGRWDDRSCESKHIFICEKNPDIIK